MSVIPDVGILFTHCQSSRGWPSTYIGDLDKPADQHARKYERLWPVSAVFQALRRVGLNVEHFGELPFPISVQS
jgi:hypothetical protein